MPDPCRSCERREIDWGGCRCQALAITGQAERTDPVCELSPDHRLIAALADTEPAESLSAYTYRRIRGHRTRERNDL
jgi:pyrroloquinoline quinone biosynthesis protein E